MRVHDPLKTTLNDRFSPPAFQKSTTSNSLIFRKVDVIHCGANSSFSLFLGGHLIVLSEINLVACALKLIVLLLRRRCIVLSKIDLITCSRTLGSLLLGRSCIVVLSWSLGGSMVGRISIVGKGSTMLVLNRRTSSTDLCNKSVTGGSVGCEYLPAHP